MTVDPGVMQSIFVTAATSLQNTPGQFNIQNERLKHKTRVSDVSPPAFRTSKSHRTLTPLIVHPGTVFAIKLIYVGGLFTLDERKQAERIPGCLRDSLRGTSSGSILLTGLSRHMSMQFTARRKSPSGLRPALAVEILRCAPSPNRRMGLGRALCLRPQWQVFRPGNRLPKFDRRVARLARRLSKETCPWSPSEGNAARRDESADEW